MDAMTVLVPTGNLVGVSFICAECPREIVWKRWEGMFPGDYWLYNGHFPDIWSIRTFRRADPKEWVINGGGFDNKYNPWGNAGWGI